MNTELIRFRFKARGPYTGYRNIYVPDTLRQRFDVASMWMHTTYGFMARDRSYSDFWWGCDI
jgi:hypothetical protein